MKEARSVRLALAIVAACASAAAIYAALRVAQAALRAEPDPALILWSEHAGYFWRAWTAAYAGGMVGFLAYAAAGRSAERTARVLAAAIVVATALLVAQGVLVP
ncbi:MAG: hypothetical protein KF764_12065 [Labilithrix sp.]|nr:hypothetical protein [Labilithrix sp.]MBX3223091.1 hypothetical protein [Labilithrix sp.]